MSYQVIKLKGVSPSKKYSEVFKRMVVEEFERGPLNKDQLQKKYGIGGNTSIFEWCKKYGKLHYPDKGKTGAPMKDPQKRIIKDLEKELADAKLKLLAYEKLISIAEKEEGISILKKDEAGQLQSLPKPTPGK
ncbi:MAG: transposase [Pedobacter sp.]|nr:MAG: transposase [Pedobacter sp.]